MTQVSPTPVRQRAKKAPVPDTALRKLLRGRHNSIRYRFVTRPREWLEYALFRLKGGTWIDYYTKRLDRAAARSKDELARQEYVVQGAEHFALIKANGLKPDDRFLDYGCGILRVGIHVIKYLAPNRYVGVEISKDRLARGQELAAQEGVPADRYNTLVVHDCHLRELGGQQFDFIWAWSVVNHMPDADVKEMLRAMRKHLAPSGQFIFMFNDGDRTGRIGIKDFLVPRATMQAWCEAAGFKFSLLPDVVQDTYRLARLTLAAKA